MCAGHNLCHLNDVLSPWQNWPERCAQRTLDNEWAMVTSQNRYGQTTTNIDRAMCTTHNQFCRSMTNVSWPMPVFADRHFFPKAHKPWIMVSVIARRHCLQADVLTPWLMRANLGWCCLLLTDIACLMSKFHVWCMENLEHLILLHEFNLTY